MVDTAQFVKAVGAALSPDGRVAELQFVRENGKTAYIQFPMEATAAVILNIEQALGKLFEAQRNLLKGQDPREFFPIGAKHVSKVQGSVAMGGIPVLSLVLDSGVRLDLSLDQTTIPDLITWLKELAAVAREPTSGPN